MRNFAMQSKKSMMKKSKVSLIILLLAPMSSNIAYADCKNHDCVCAPSELQFASTVPQTEKEAGDETSKLQDAKKTKDGKIRRKSRRSQRNGLATSTSTDSSTENSQTTTGIVGETSSVTKGLVSSARGDKNVAKTVKKEAPKLPIALEADDVQADGQKSVTLTGNAQVSQGRQTIVADKLQYFRDSERVVATGAVEMISNRGDYISSDSIDVMAPTHIGQVNNANFKLATSISTKDGIDTVKIGSRGTAKIAHLEGEGLLRLEDATYTMCKEGNDDVVISAGQIELDQIEGVGVARNAVVRFLDVSIFYMPYLSFPINDDRKTGLLAPGFGRDDDSGNIFEMPWYWNIAPHQDATITPRYYSERGIQIAGEYRRKTESANTFVYAENLSGDEIYTETLSSGEVLSDQDRYMFSLRHTQKFTKKLTGQINFNTVSDVDYFDDFRNDVSYFSATYVPRDASLSYTDKYFKLGARLNQYQIIDDIISESGKPYERLPSLTLSTFFPKGPLDMRYGVEASVTRFAHSSREEGTRTAITPSIEIPFENLWGYIKPKVSLNYRNYQVDYDNYNAYLAETNAAALAAATVAGTADAFVPTVASGQEESQSFTVPIFSIDAGLSFEKNTSWFGGNAHQTLEPRVFYVYAPEEDQRAAPVFDTSAVSLNNFNNIFRENRFYGNDRVGDTNQVTLGLTTRITDNETGDQRLKASIGQLYLLDDLQQNIDPDQTIESGLGDFLAEMRTEAENSFTTYSFVQYDHDRSEVRNARFDIGYEPKDDERKRVSVGYFYTKGITLEGAETEAKGVDQITLSGTWPLADRWQIFGSERYSLEDSESISTTLGLEYNACCWKVRFIGNERMNDNDINDKKTSYFVELELTNLGSFRTALDKFQ